VPTPAPPTFRIEAQLGVTAFFVNTSFVNPNFIGGGSSWEDLTPDVVGDSFSMQYGIVGSTPTDRTASAGSLRFTLRNDDWNSAGVEGYYSPFHASKRVGFDYNIPIRLVITYDGITTYKFYGSLADVVPRVAEFPVTECIALDIFDDFARIEEPELPVQINKRGDEILNTMFDLMTTQPVRRDFEVGQETWAVALDGGTGQKLTVRERINQINLSEFGYCYPVGDRVSGGTVKWESRRHRAANPVVRMLLTDAEILLDGSFSVQGSRDDFYRSVNVTVFPTNDIPSTLIDVLFSLQTTQTNVLPGETNSSIFGPYRDPVNNDQVGGTDTVDPVANLDYKMNAAADGSGIDLTANFTVTSSRTAAGVRFTITNNGTVAGYVTKLQQRGRKVARSPVMLTASVSGSYGDQILDLEMPFQNNVNVGRDVAQYLSQTLSETYPNLPPVKFLASRDDAHLHVAFELEPGDRIAITEHTTGVDSRQYTINSVRLDVTAEDLIWCTWGLESASTQRYWMIGIVGSSEIGIDTNFGF